MFEKRGGKKTRGDCGVGRPLVFTPCSVIFRECQWG